MADTIREQLIQAFTTQVQTLTTNPVIRAQRFHEIGTDKNISVWDGEDVPADTQRYGVQRNSFSIAIYAQWVVVENPSVDANVLLGDVITLLMNGDNLTLNGLAERMEYSGAVPDYTEEGSNLAAITITFTIHYTTVKGDPFTQGNV